MSDLLSPALTATAGLSAVSLVVLLRGVHTDDFRLRVGGKLTASAAFLAGAALCGLHSHGPAGVAFTAGLWLSFLGDALLLSDQKKVFLAGLGAFLLGHLAYTAGFWMSGLEPLGLGLGGIVLLPLAVVVWGWLRPHVGKMRWAVVAYITVISAMAMSAVGTAWFDPTLAHLVLLAAAVLFFLSDLFVARNRFITAEPLNRYVGLPLYYVAQWLFVLGGAA